MPVQLNMAPLQRLRSSVAGLGRQRAHVGLFSDKAARRPDGTRQNAIPDNPSLGAIHEFGLSFSRVGDQSTTTIPRRSFLQMPLSLVLGNEVLRGGILWANELITHGSEYTLALLGMLGEDVVQEAFNTGGFGQWPALAPETIRRKRSARILIETSQLRKAVSSRVI